MYIHQHGVGKHSQNVLCMLLEPLVCESNHFVVNVLFQVANINNENVYIYMMCQLSRWLVEAYWFVYCFNMLYFQGSYRSALTVLDISNTDQYMCKDKSFKYQHTAV